MVYNTFLKIFFNTFIDFGMAASFWYTAPQHTACYDCFALWFSSIYIRSKEVFGLMSNVSVNWRSDFLTKYCFAGTDCPDDIGLFSLNSSGVDTMLASIIDLYFCLSSHFSDNLYNFLMFSRHLCSYKALLLNYRFTPIITICCLSRYDCNNPLRMIHCLNEPISRILSITLV